ncbi:MAG: chloride channel protein [Candidatus Latescibacterota bacterium]|nr:MAG: chloride channel protein [Candidatus Latescibacterota bacterium]
MTRFQRLVLGILSAFNMRSIGRYMMFGVVVGVVAGLGAVLFYVLCQLGQHYLLDGLAGYRPDEPAGEPSLFGHTDTPFRRYLLILIPALGGLIAGVLVYVFAPEAEGHGTDAAIDAFHHRHGRIRGRVPIVKAIASAVTLGSGGSGGREGPIAQIGAGFGAFFGDKLRLSARERRILLAAGLGAGIGSIFRAPLAGSLFAAEILYKEPEFEHEVIIPAFVTTIVAYSTFGLILGFNPLFAQTSFTFSHPFELGPYTVLALVLALASPLFIKCFYGVNHLFKKLRVPNHFKPAIGGLLTGCIGFFYPDTLAFGYGVIQDALNGNLAVSFLFIVAIGKILTTSFSIGSGGSGGVFGPSMVIGGALGGAVGKIFHQLTPGIITHPGPFVIVGMAGFFAAASNAPISTIIMVSEMTGNYNLLVPAMWVCAIAFIVGRRWSIYQNQVDTRADSPAHYGDFAKDLLEEIYVRDIFHPDSSFSYVPENLTLREFVPIMTEANQQNFPVVNSSNEMTGIVSINDVREILVERDLDNLLIMKEIASEDVPIVTLDDNLAHVLRRFTENEVDTLPVVETEDSRELLGMLRRREVTRSYYERLSAMKRISDGI